MGTPYIHTDESALETLRIYRNDYGHDTFNDALVSMAQNLDDLEPDERGAFNHIMRDNALHHRVMMKTNKQVTGWSLNLYWNDGSIEERHDSPMNEYLNEWINEIESEVNDEI